MRTIFCVLATLMLGLTGMQAQSLKATFARHIDSDMNDAIV